MAIGLGTLLLGSIISSLVGSGVNAAITYATNKQNMDLANDVNQQQQSNLEHAHEIEMKDLQNAGLNPILTATGGSGSPMVNLNSAKSQAPQLDMSGINTALNGLMHMQMMSTLLGEKNAAISNLVGDRNNAISRLNDARAEYYLRKTAALGSHGYSNAAVHSSKQVNNALNSVASEKEWKKIMKELEALDYMNKF